MQKYEKDGFSMRAEQTNQLDGITSAVKIISI